MDHSRKVGIKFCTPAKERERNRKDVTGFLQLNSLEASGRTGNLKDICHKKTKLTPRPNKEVFTVLTMRCTSAFMKLMGGITDTV